MDARLVLDESVVGLLARVGAPARKPPATTSTARASATPATPTPTATTPGKPRTGTPPVVSPTEKFYLTTAINYTNGPPHIGHAYEAVCSDIIVRYHRAAGRKVYFLTGTDEHGQKVEQSALAGGRTPQEHCDMYAALFKDLDAKLQISFDQFVRTTDADHETSSIEMWKRVAQRKTPDGRDNIYLGNYSGWYNRFDEQFVTRAEVEVMPKNELGEPLDKLGRPLEKKEEPAYFFRMSAYKDALVEHMRRNPLFVQPPSSRGEIEAFLKQDLEDLCISRTTITWGVPCPVPEPGHVMYVWFDALTNYVTGAGTLLGPGKDKGLWPADVHVIGKDITRFHVVYWPTMLMAAGLELPRTVFAHGFVTAADGQKMGKSLGNARDPVEQVQLYGSDAFRYYVARQTTFGNDLPYGDAGLVSAHNDILLKGLGNLAQRSVKTAALFCDGKVPAEATWVLEDGSLPFDLAEAQHALERCFQLFPAAAASGGAASPVSTPTTESAPSHEHGLNIRAAILAFEHAVANANVYLDRCAPWKLKGDEHAATRRAMVRGALEAVYALAHFASIFIPASAAGILRAFAGDVGATFRPLHSLNPLFNNLPAGTAVTEYSAPVFEELQEGVGVKPKTDIETALADKKAKKEKVNAETVARRIEKSTAKSAAEAKENPVSAVEICVGRVLEAKIGAGDLFVEKVDVGRAEPLDVASGLGAHYKPEDIVDRLVCVVLNFEPFTPKQLPSFTSRGMLLAAKDAATGKVELLLPPAGSKPGQRVGPAGCSDVAPAPLCKSKQWDKAKKVLCTSTHESGVVMCGPASTDPALVVFDAGEAPVVAPTVRGGSVS